MIFIFLGEVKIYTVIFQVLNRFVSKSSPISKIKSSEVLLDAAIPIKETMKMSNNYLRPGGRHNTRSTGNTITQDESKFICTTIIPSDITEMSSGTTITAGDQHDTSLRLNAATVKLSDVIVKSSELNVKSSTIISKPSGLMIAGAPDLTTVKSTIASIETNENSVTTNESAVKTTGSAVLTTSTHVKMSESPVKVMLPKFSRAHVKNTGAPPLTAETSINTTETPRISVQEDEMSVNSSGLLVISSQTTGKLPLKMIASPAKAPQTTINPKCSSASLSNSKDNRNIFNMGKPVVSLCMLDPTIHTSLCSQATSCSKICEHSKSVLPTTQKSTVQSELSEKEEKYVDTSSSLPSKSCSQKSSVSVIKPSISITKSDDVSDEIKEESKDQESNSDLSMQNIILPKIKYVDTIIVETKSNTAISPIRQSDVTNIISSPLKSSPASKELFPLAFSGTVTLDDWKNRPKSQNRRKQKLNSDNLRTEYEPVEMKAIEETKVEVENSQSKSQKSPHVQYKYVKKISTDQVGASGLKIDKTESLCFNISSVKTEKSTYSFGATDDITFDERKHPCEYMSQDIYLKYHKLISRENLAKIPAKTNKLHREIGGKLRRKVKPRVSIKFSCSETETYFCKQVIVYKNEHTVIFSLTTSTINNEEFGSRFSIYS